MCHLPLVFHSSFQIVENFHGNGCGMYDNQIIKIELTRGCCFSVNTKAEGDAGSIGLPPADHGTRDNYYLFTFNVILE